METPMALSRSPAIVARAVGLLLFLAIGSQSLVAMLRGFPVGQGGLFLCFYIHVWVSIYDGIFDRKRRIVWLVMSFAWIGALAADILAYVLPWGQMAGWSATVLANLVSQLPVSPEWRAALLDTLVAFFASDIGLGLRVSIILLPVLLLMLDGALMHNRDEMGQWRRRKEGRAGCLAIATLALALGAASALVIEMVTAPARNATSPDAYAILPPWSFLPFYAILRSPPDKLAGLLAMVVAMAVILPVPWLVSAGNRLRPLRHWFQLACALLITCWLGLGWLGGQPPEEPIIWMSWGLAACYFAFFLVVLPFFAIWARRQTKTQAHATAAAFD